MLFYEQQRLDFLGRNENTPDTGLYLVLAANNAGKTSFIRALKFLFYGAESIGGGVKPESVVCQKSLAEAQSNHLPKCFVEARVIHRGSEYTLRRELIYRRGNNITEVTIVSERAVYVAHNPTRDETVTDPETFAYRIRSMVPEELFDFFFFMGEELSSRLLKGQKDHSLQDSLMAIFHKSDWDLAEEHLADLAKFYHQKVVSAQKKNASASALVEQKEKLLKDYKGYETLLGSLRESHKTKRTVFDELEKQIVDAASSKHEQLKSEIQSLKERIAALSSQDVEHHRRMFREINHSGPMVLVMSGITKVREYLDTLEHKKILPAVVAEDFFSHLLKEKKCICERDLDLGSPERAFVEQRRSLCLTANVGQSLRNLSASLNPDNAVGLPQKAVKGLKNIRQESEKIESIRNDKLDLEEKLRMRRDKLESLPESDLQKLVQEKRKKELELRDLERTITTTEIEEGDAKQMLAGIERQLNEMGISGQAAPLDVESEKLCIELSEWVVEMRDGLRDSFSVQLQKNVSHLYKQIVTDQSEAVIDKDTLLPSINLNGQKGIAVGGAQSQALCLAYILSLAKLRREVAAELKDLFYGSKTPPSGDQAFAMDSIFAPMQGNYVRETAAFLPGKAKQLIMLLSAKQFDEKVQKEWLGQSKGNAGKINKAWCFLLHMPPEKYKTIEEDEKATTFKNKTVELLVPVNKNGHQYNEIKPL
ncbi:unnamed protein product [Sphagnum balticum]